MHTDKNLQFIRNKILDTQVALFHCYTNSLLRIHNTIIQTHKVDDDGNIWFFIPRPQQLISQFEQEFMVGLKYFRKGSDYSIHITGKARMLIDPEELNCETELTPEEISKALSTMVLVKVKIQNVEFYEHSIQHKGFLAKAKSFVYSLLDWAEPNAKRFEFGQGNPMHYGF
jgi:general stress protein 26